MVAYTDSLGFTKGSPSFSPYVTTHNVSFVNVDLDFKKIADARAAAGVPALAATDTLEVLPVRKGTVVLAATAWLVTPEGATATIDLGDADSATRYFSNLNLNAAAGTVSASTLSAPYVYNADGAIRITVDHNNVDAAKVRLGVLFFNVDVA
ncbi:MAG: hypothetical protein QW318_07140 [Candidatus Caldarchaeum sp.]